MASSFADEGLVDFWKAALGISGLPIPGTADLIAAPFSPGPGLTYGGLAWETAHKVNVTPLWTVTLQGGSHYVSAVATVSIVFSAGFAGQVFYGIGLHGNANAPLFYSESFAAPYQVPVGGGTLTWTFNLNFGDCVFVP